MKIATSVQSIRERDGRKFIIGVTGLVVLSVSLLSCVTYIGLMGNVFPDGLFRLLAYFGAVANFLLMVVLLLGKFNWFRPGTHEYASWGVTAVEVVICALNLIVAYQLGHGGVQFPLNYWLQIAPATPVFSMVGAIILIMTSSDIARKHKAMQAREDMEDAEQSLALQQHEAQIGVKSTYVDYVQQAMTRHLNSERVHRIIEEHAEHMVLQSLASVSGLSTTPMSIGRVPSPVVDSNISLAQTGTVEPPKSIDTSTKKDGGKKAGN